MPLPHNGYCPSHQHLAETEEIARRARRFPAACSSASTSAAPSRTPCSPPAGGWSRPRRRRRRTTSPRACSPPSRRRWRRPARTPSEVEAFAHGTTVATNALLEGDGARTVLVATAGFEDVVELGRQARADLYRLCAAHPAPLVPPERRVGAPERMRPDGPAAPLADPAALVDARSRSWIPRRSRSACCTPTATPSTSRRSATALAERLPGVHVSLVHEVVGTFREYERAATTEIDAALSPLLVRLPAAAGRARAGRGPAGARRHAVLAAGWPRSSRPRAHAALTVLVGPGRRRRRRGLGRARRRRAGRAVLRHGRHVVRRLRDRGRARPRDRRPARRRPPDRAADARPAHGRRRRRLDRLARRGRRAARRPAVGGRAPGAGRATATAARSRR